MKKILRLVAELIVFAFAACPLIAIPPQGLGQEQAASAPARSDVPNDALRNFRQAFPAADLSRAEIKQAFKGQRDYRKALNSVAEGEPGATATIVEADVTSEFAVEHGNSVRLDVIFCDNPKAIRAIEDEISTFVAGRHLHIGPRGWNEGLLDVTSRERGNIFKSPPLWEDVSLLVQLSKSLSDEQPLVTLVYEVKSSLHFNDPYTDQSTSTEVTDYMNALNADIRKVANTAIQVNCSKISSGATKSEKVAIETVNGRLSKARQEQLSVQLHNNK